MVEADLRPRRSLMDCSNVPRSSWQLQLPSIECVVFSRVSEPLCVCHGGTELPLNRHSTGDLRTHPQLRVNTCFPHKPALIKDRPTEQPLSTSTGPAYRVTHSWVVKILFLALGFSWILSLLARNTHLYKTQGLPKSEAGESSPSPHSKQPRCAQTL